MTDQNTQTPLNPQSNIPHDVQTSNGSNLQTPPAKKTLDKAAIMEILTGVITKIKGDRRLMGILIGITVVFVLIIVFGIIFKLINSSKSGAAAVTPTPTATPQIILTEESKTNELRLKQLKENIQKLDVNQRYLTPPEVEFDVVF